MKIALFDTETTGLLVDAPARDPRQPHIVQLAVLLVDGSGQELESHDIIVAPDGWKIPEDSTEVHGITQERAISEGIPEATAARIARRIINEADVAVAHNLPFDKQIIRIALRRHGLLVDPETTWGIEGKEFCTMRAMTPICKLPSMRGVGYKWPKLTEAYQHAFRESFDGAHDAMNDLRATYRLYRWLMEREGKKIA